MSTLSRSHLVSTYPALKSCKPRPRTDTLRTHLLPRTSTLLPANKPFSMPFYTNVRRHHSRQLSQLKTGTLSRLNHTSIQYFSSRMKQNFPPSSNSLRQKIRSGHSENRCCWTLNRHIGISLVIATVNEKDGGVQDHTEALDLLHKVQR